MGIQFSVFFFRLHGINIMAAAPNDIFTKTIGALPIDTVKTCVEKMEILDRVNRIDRI